MEEIKIEEGYVALESNPIQSFYLNKCLNQEIKM